MFFVVFDGDDVDDIDYVLNFLVVHKVMLVTFGVNQVFVSDCYVVYFKFSSCSRW
jgi:hypothetical protein